MIDDIKPLLARRIINAGHINGADKQTGGIIAQKGQNLEHAGCMNDEIHFVILNIEPNDIGGESRQKGLAETIEGVIHSFDPAGRSGAD